MPPPASKLSPLPGAFANAWCCFIPASRAYAMFACSIAPQLVVSAPAAPAAAVVVPAALPAAPKTTAAPVAVVSAVPLHPAPTPMAAAPAPPHELQSYEISPYKSGSDRCAHGRSHGLRALQLTAVSCAARRRLPNGPASRFHPGHEGAFLASAGTDRACLLCRDADALFRIPAMRWHRCCTRKRRRTPMPSSRTRQRLAGACLTARALESHCSPCLPPFCSLDEVFQCAGSKKRDFSRRGSSGNWTEDQLTWKEEQSFKRRMGYAAGLSEATPRSAQGGSRT